MPFPAVPAGERIVTQKFFAMDEATVNQTTSLEDEDISPEDLKRIVAPQDQPLRALAVFAPVDCFQPISTQDIPKSISDRADHPVAPLGINVSLAYAVW